MVRIDSYEAPTYTIKHDRGVIIGTSPAMMALFHVVNALAAEEASVLIRGETGTGKELVAKALHYNGSRAVHPFVVLDCSRIPAQLAESIVEGHKKGSFTGALTDRRGFAQAAHKGTLFLDEIGDMPLVLQSKILRLLQEREVTPVGSTDPVKVDIRVVAATNRNIEHMVDEGTFREDLFYRLNVIPIEVPQLKNRKGDIEPLASYFLEKYGGGRELFLSRDALKTLEGHGWRGNVRELENCMQRVPLVRKINGASGKVISDELWFGKSAPMSALIRPGDFSDLDRDDSSSPNAGPGKYVPDAVALPEKVRAHVRRPGNGDGEGNGTVAPLQVQSHSGDGNGEGNGTSSEIHTQAPLADSPISPAFVSPSAPVSSPPPQTHIVHSAPPITGPAEIPAPVAAGPASAPQVRPLEPRAVPIKGSIDDLCDKLSAMTHRLWTPAEVRKLTTDLDAEEGAAVYGVQRASFNTLLYVQGKKSNVKYRVDEHRRVKVLPLEILNLLVRSTKIAPERITSAFSYFGFDLSKPYNKNETMALVDSMRVALSGNQLVANPEEDGQVLQPLLDYKSLARITYAQAGELLGMTERDFRRKRLGDPDIRRTLSFDAVTSTVDKHSFVRYVASDMARTYEGLSAERQLELVGLLGNGVHHADAQPGPLALMWLLEGLFSGKDKEQDIKTAKGLILSQADLRQYLTLGPDVVIKPESVDAFVKGFCGKFPPNQATGFRDLALSRLSQAPGYATKRL